MSSVIVSRPPGLYVVGFAFCEELKSVLLFRKTHPEWQAHKLNGIGGRVEIGESPVQAMVREFEDGTGLRTTKDDWLSFHYERYAEGARIHYYTAQLLAVDLCRAQPQFQGREIPERWNLNSAAELPPLGLSFVHNLKPLLQMARNYIVHPEHRYLEG